jgi:preprotein translocase SecE subunit
VQKAFLFLKEVQQELRQVVWPSWKEVKLGFFSVVVVVALASLFLFFVDASVFRLVRWLITGGW